MEKWYTRWRGKVAGPFDKDQLLAHARAGQISRHHSVSADGAHWTSAGNLDWLFVRQEIAKPDLLASEAPTKAELPSHKNAEENGWTYSVDDGPEIGPVTLGVLQQLARSGQLKADDQVLPPGGKEWVEAREARGLKFSRPERAKPRETANEPVAGPAKDSQKNNTLSHMALGFSLVSLLLFPPFIGFAAFVCAIVGVAVGENKVYAALVLLASIICPVLGMVLGVAVATSF